MLHDRFTVFMEGGIFMNFILLADKALLVLVVLALMINRRGLWIAVLVAVLVPLLLGCYAYFSGMAEARAAVQYANPEEQAFLLQMSRSVAVYPLQFGIVSSLLFAVVIGLGMYLRYKRRGPTR